MMVIANSADAFQSIDGGAGRACRGANETDTQPAYYVSYNPLEVSTLAACKAMCVATPDLPWDSVQHLWLPSLDTGRRN